MVNFNFSFDPGTTLQQMVGIEIAGRIWSAYLTDPVTVNLQVGVSSSLGSNVIGGALPGMSAHQQYSSFTNALKADATSADDQTALKQVSGSSFSANYQLTALGLTSSWTGTSSSINLTRADAKALGLINADDPGLDGYILLGSLAGASVQWNYDYTRSASAPTNSLDFLATALHEIGHTLGFVSGLDSPGWLDSNFGIDMVALLAATSQLNAITNGATPLDLFRYSTQSSIFTPTTSNTRDLTLGGSKVFALGSGSTPIAYFSTGDTSQGGNGYEASHWLTGTNSIEAPTLKTGTRSAISKIDLMALDVIGYNLASTGINTTINLATLQSQAQEGLASRLGQTASWLNANATTAAQTLATDGTQAISTMIANSKIYGLNRITPPGSPGTPSLIFTQLFQEQGLFDTIDDLEVLPAAAVQISLEALTTMPPPKDYATTSRRSQPLTTVDSDSLRKIALALAQTNFSPSFQKQDESQHRSINAIINLSSQKAQSLPPSSGIGSSSDRVITGKADYYYFGSSKPVTYAAADKSAQQQFDSLAHLDDLSAAL